MAIRLHPRRRHPGVGARGPGFALLALVLGSCGNDDAGEPADSNPADAVGAGDAAPVEPTEDGSSPVDASPDETDDPSTRDATDDDSADAHEDTDSHDVGGAVCEVLFGRPAENTGLTDDQCRPSCDCDELRWEQPPYDASTYEALRAWENTVPFEPVAEDPYALESPPEEAPTLVCAVVRESDDARRYHVETFSDEDAAWDAGAIPTHYGACGACSTLANLEVYLRVADLTTPVRACALRGLTAGQAVTVACLIELGFDLPCATIWGYNAAHTRDNCLSECIRTLNDPFHLPDGSLNPCIACDEERSGDVFKAVAGRTRRNSGMATALCRPCSEVRPLIHDYDTPRRVSR